jgi:hypothetical protein
MGTSLGDRIRNLPGSLLAIDAAWDGDTDGWFIDLHAVVEQEPNHVSAVLLTCISMGGDVRLFTGQVPPWPEAEEAQRMGQSLAEEFGVTFHFPSPETPDADCARWWELDRGHPCSGCGKKLIGGARYKKDPWPWPGACQTCLDRRRADGFGEVNIEIEGVPADSREWFEAKVVALRQIVVHELGGLLRLVNCLGQNTLWIMTMVGDIDRGLGLIRSWLTIEGLLSSARVSVTRPGAHNSAIVQLD